MNPHVAPVKSALEEFCRVYAADGAEWGLEVYPSGFADDIHAIIVHPAFRGMDPFERQRHISDFLESHLAVEHRVSLMLRRALTPDEYEDTQAAERHARVMGLACWPDAALNL